MIVEIISAGMMVVGVGLMVYATCRMNSVFKKLDSIEKLKRKDNV